MTNDEHEREAEWRWGEGPQFEESRRRTDRYRPEDWARLRSEGQALTLASAVAMKRGVAPDSAEGMALAELHREYNSRWFYQTDHAMHARLAEGYVSDPRFTKTYEDVAPGLAAWHAASIQANARRAGANLDIGDALAAVKAGMGLATAPSPGPLAQPEDKMQPRAREVATRAQRGRRR